MAHYKDDKVLIPEQDYASADKERRVLVRSICDDAVYPGWFDGLDVETKCNIVEVVLVAFEHGSGKVVSD